MKKLGLHKKHEVDMTQGGVFRHLLVFALPLLAGNIFQQLYNTVDTWVVGNYVSDAAFSAVGSVAPIINMLIGTFMGLASGAGVVISQYYGAKNEEKVRDTVHTALLMTLVLAILFTGLGILITPVMLDLMNTPDSVRPEARTYLTILFAGIIGPMFYNMGAGILRAVGDSRRPFYFLVMSTILNTVLDLLFVIAFDMGVEGVAYATILTQFVSAVSVMITLLRTDSCVRIVPRELRVHGDILRKIIRVGIPAALQMAVTAFSNVFVQSYINAFGADCMGGWTAYHKIDQLIFLPMQSLSLAATTFVGQNLGVRQVKRARQGTRTALLSALTVTAVISALVVAAAPALVAFFNDTPEVVSFGTLFLRVLTPFYIICCVNQVYIATLRGAGNSRTPMLIMLFSFVLFRQIYLFVMANFVSNTVIPIAMGYPVGWLMCSVLISLYYHRAPMDRMVLIADAPPDKAGAAGNAGKPRTVFADTDYLFGGPDPWWKKQSVPSPISAPRAASRWWWSAACSSWPPRRLSCPALAASRRCAPKCWATG